MSGNNHVTADRGTRAYSTLAYDLRVGTTPPFVSVVIPVYNDAQRLKKCLQALETQTYPSSRYEVIVVDNGSEDDVAKWTAESRATLVFEPRAGSYAARNTGISSAAGEVLAFTDADCIPRANWLENGVKALLSTPNCGLVAGEIEIFCRDPARPSAAETYDRIRGFEQKIFLEEKKYGATANIFTFRRVLEHVGVFDADLKSGGDKEWGERVFAAGYAQVFAKDACVDHPARYSTSELFRKILRITHARPRKKKGIVPILGTYYRNLLPPIGDIASAWRDPRLPGIRVKLQFIYILFVVRVARLVKQTRLLLGGDQQRQ